MVIRGGIRGNGAQLADYLLAKKDNDNVRVFDIRGTSQPFNLKKSLIEMSLSAELSRRTKKGLYHVVINPDPEASRQMTAADWHRAADIMEAHTGFTRQKRIMVLHEKKDRVHMHVVWERWDWEHSRVISNKNSRYAQNRARKQMEIEFGHRRTPNINIEKRELHKLATRLWQDHPSGQDFIRALDDHGYTVCRSDGRRPIVVVNRRGLSFDLVRPIKGAKTRDVQDRLKGVPLPKDKRVMERIADERKLRPKRHSREQKIVELQEEMQQKKKDRGR